MYTNRRIWLLWGMVPVLWMFSGSRVGAGGPCGGCGGGSCVERVCRLVCEMKDVKTTVYNVTCEDFCTMGRSYPAACNSDPCQCVPDRIPTCGRVHCRRKLVKHEVTKKVPSYKCVVEYVCRECGARYCTDCR